MSLHVGMAISRFLIASEANLSYSYLKWMMAPKWYKFISNSVCSPAFASFICERRKYGDICSFCHTLGGSAINGSRREKKLSFV